MAEQGTGATFEETVQQLSLSKRARFADAYHCLKQIDLTALGKVLSEELGFSKFRCLGAGDDAVVLEVIGEGVVIRLARNGFEPPVKPEVMQQLDSFYFTDHAKYFVIDDEKHFPYTPSICIQTYFKGNQDVTKREAGSLNRSLESQGWFWRESNPENAIRGKTTGKAYISDSDSVYPVSGIGRPIFSLNEVPNSCFYELKEITTPVIRELGALLQKGVFALRQMLHLRLPFQSWSFEDQIKDTPEKYRPGSAWHIEKDEKRKARLIKEKPQKEFYELQSKIDSDICFEIDEKIGYKVWRKVTGDPYGGKEITHPCLNAERAKVGDEQWFALSKEGRYQRVHFAVQEVLQPRKNEKVIEELGGIHYLAVGRPTTEEDRDQFRVAMKKCAENPEWSTLSINDRVQRTAKELD